MFQFAGYLSCRPCIHLQMTAHVCCRVPPFGHLRFFASLQLHGAFRSLARPSSVSSGQAFAVRPSLLNQWFSCVSRCSLSRTVFYCFLSLSYNLRFRPFLLCLFFLVAQFSKIDSLREVLDLSKLNRYTHYFLQFPLFFFLLRKEVIHPHVPVGIPCYDLTPVIGPAFDGSLPEGLCHRLRALPTPMV